MTEERSMLQLNVSSRLKEHLVTAAKWARIAAIIGFVAAGVTIIESIRENNVLSSLVEAGISVMLNVYLINFANKADNAIAATDQEQFNEGLHALRMYFKITGILLAIAFSIGLLVVVFGGLG